MIFDFQGERIWMLDKHPTQSESPERQPTLCRRPDSRNQIAREELCPGSKTRSNDTDDVLAIVQVFEDVSEDEGFDERLLSMELVESFATAGFDHQLASVHPVSVDSEGFGVDTREVYGNREARSPAVVAGDASKKSRCPADEVLAYKDEFPVFVDSHRKDHAVVRSRDKVSRKRVDSLWDQILYRMGCSDCLL